MHVTILMAEHCAAASSTLALEVLQAANLFYGDSHGERCFDVVTASIDGNPVMTSSGQAMPVDAALEHVSATDIVLIPGFIFTLKAAIGSFSAYKPWLEKQHRAGAMIASMCNSAFLLADSGLLDGRRATTHWAFTEFFRRLHPSVHLDETLIVCDDGELITSGGATAAMDLLLYIIRRFVSLDLAQTCARYLLVDGIRQGQTPYAQWAMPKNHSDTRIVEVQQWLESNFASAVSIDELGKQFGFGVRNFKRRFKEATGHTPLTYIQTLRVEKAKALLESTRMNFEAITMQVGYEDTNSFRRLFSKQVGLTPTFYRKKFCSERFE
ncbi:MAG: transcriptional regulator [Oceanospirillaceae bacterium]|nr:transcriptional regulator [Oceanospirillaceae bacterium]